ncbi:MAG TPA: hypothetical protein VHW92_05215 [Mycobacteriales bacterium]|jgi:hypothetical protein|nr:hypothetical protein [Mycobacteriales bacterium]
MSSPLKIRLIGAVAAAAAVIIGACIGWHSPAWYAVPLLVAAVVITEVAVVHLSFGRQRWTFSLTEAAIAIAFVHSPYAWSIASVAVGVTAAQLIRRQEPLKLQFNVAQFAAATALGAGFASLVGGGIWGAVGGMGVFWLANNLLIAQAVSIMTNQRLLALLWASAPLAAVNSFGTSGLGILAAWLATNAPIGLLALVVPLLLLWISYDEQTSRAAEAQLYAELARLQERASGRSVDVSAQVVLTAAARLFGSDDVEMVLMAGDGPVHYGGDGHGLTRRRVEREALDTPWVLRALGGDGVAVGTDNGQPWISTVLGRSDEPLAVLVARRATGSVGFGRREAQLADVLKQQAESWLSIAELAASRDEALAHAEAAEDAARALGDIGADTAPSLVTLRESANRLARLAATDGPASVHEIVDELYAVERAVASLLGAIALAAEPDLGRHAPTGAQETSTWWATDWTTTGVLSS